MKDAVLPSLIGRPQGARLTAHPVNLPNPLNDLARGVSALGPGAERLGLSLAALVQERDEADYRRTLNDAVAAADARMQSEVWSQEGFAAKGVSEKAASIYQEVAGEYGAKLSGRNARRFAEAFGARRNTQVNSVLGFERGQLQKAQLGANASLIKSETANYIATGSAGALNAAREAYDDSVRLTNGGRLVSNDTLAAFDADVKDGDGRVKLPDGRSLRIVDHDHADPKTEISRKEIARIRENMEKQAKAYHLGLQNLYDAAHAGTVERYLRNDMIGEAERYLETVSDPNHSQPASKAVLSTLADAVTRKRRAWSISADAARIVSGIQAEAGAEAGLYGSAKQDGLYAEALREINGMKADPQYKAAVLSSVRTSYAILKEQQKAKLAADVVDTMKRFQDERYSLPEQGKQIQGMPDSPLKDALVRAYDRQVRTLDRERKAAEQAFNSNTDVGFLAEQEQLLNRFKLAVSRGGKHELDGVTYDFSDPDRAVAYARALGLTEANRKRAAGYLKDSKSRLDADLVVKEAAEQLGVTSEKVFGYAPYLMSRLEEAKGSAVIEPAKMREWIKSSVARILSEEMNRDKNWWPDSSGTLGDYMKLNKDFSPGTLYMTEDQFNRVFYREAILRALRNKDWNRFRALSEAAANGDKNGMFFNEREAFRRRFDDRGGLLYIKGSNQGSK